MASQRFSRRTSNSRPSDAGWKAALVPGTVFEISQGELEQADRYEVVAYRRVLAKLLSGRSAWVYVDARRAPPI